MLPRSHGIAGILSLVFNEAPWLHSTALSGDGVQINAVESSAGEVLPLVSPVEVVNDASM